MQFNEVVNFVSAPELKNRLKKFPHVGKIPTRKAEMTSLALTLSTSTESLLAYWDTLDASEKRALQETVHTHDGHLNEAFYAAKYKSQHPRLTRHGYYETTADDAKLLTCFYPAQRYGLPRVIPDEIVAKLKQVIPQPESYTVETFDTLPEAAKSDTLQSAEKAEPVEYLSSQQSEAELHALLNLVKQRAIKVSEKTGNPAKAQLNKLKPIVKDYYDTNTQSDEHNLEGIRVQGWLQILKSASWISVKSGILQIRESKFNSGQAVHELLSGLFNDWMKNSEQDELSRINHIKGQSGKGKKSLTKPALRRQGLAATLTRCPTDKWLHVDEFLDLTVINKCYCPVSLEPEHLYICDAHYGRLYNDHLPWSRYNLCLLMEYFATLGIIDIAFGHPDNVRDDHHNSWGSMEMGGLSRYDGLQYIRLTALGAWIVGKSDSYTPSKVKHATAASVMADGRIHFQQSPQAGETLFLSTYADEITPDSWQLCQEKMISYLETGGELNELKAFITERDPQPFLPDEVESLFKNLQQNKQAVVSEGKVLLLTCASKKVAKHIADVPELKGWCKTVGEQQLIIPINKENIFRKIIHQLNYAMPVSKT